MKNIISLALILIGLQSKAQVVIAHDKQQHFEVGIVVGGLSAAISRKPIRTAIIISAAAGAGKELHDRARGYKFDLSDFGSTVLGGIAGGIIVKQIRKIKRKRK